MLSPVSRRFGSNPLQSLSSRVQGPSGDVKSKAVQPVDSKQAKELQEVLSTLEQLLEQLVQQLSGGKINSLGSSSGTSSSGSSSAAPVGGSRSRSQDSFSPSSSQAAPSGLPSLDGSSPTSGGLLAGIQVSDPRVRQALEQIATHPDGAKLIAAAKANGLSSISVNPGLNPDGGGGTEGVTYSGTGNTRIELANANSADLVQTLAHELGHAATTGDGDSQLEERTVDELGNRIQQDLLGRSSGFSLDQGAYSGLSQDNGILNSLRTLGIRV
jgi:hypothetical protein